MRQLAIFIAIAACVSSGSAQTLYADTANPSTIHLPPGPKIKPSAKTSSFFRNLRLELPMAGLLYGVPIRNKALLGLPYGMDTYLYPTHPAIGFLGSDYSFRWIAVYYKDKIGIEFYSDGFGGAVQMDGFNHYIVTKFPGYYDNTTAYNDLHFEGQALGIAYRAHWRSFVLEPKFIFGFESYYNQYPLNTFVLKERGSNQFVDYSIHEYDNPHHQHSYQPRLLLGYRWHPRKHSAEYELGTRWEYIYSPYTLQVAISQQSYGQPPVNNQLNVAETYRQFNAGIYFKVYLHQWIY